MVPPFWAFPWTGHWIGGVERWLSILKVSLRQVLVTTPREIEWRARAWLWQEERLNDRLVPLVLGVLNFNRKRPFRPRDIQRRLTGTTDVPGFESFMTED